MPAGPHAHLTVDQLQALYSSWGTTIADALEEQHRICEELMNRAEPDQAEVDWSVVRGAVHDTCDENGIGGDKALAASFKSNGLIVAHQPDAAPDKNTDCKNEGAKVGAAGECLACDSEAGEKCQLKPL